MAKFLMTELVDVADVVTARIGGDSAPVVSSDWLTDKDVGKFMKLAGSSRYDLCAAGDEIEGRLNSYETASQDGYAMGGVMTEGRFQVTLDGLQATPGTGTVALGDYVVCGTVVAKGTALSAPAKVCKATAAGNTKNFKWRVVSIGTGGTDTGTVGKLAIIECLC